jgi:hypothetical protein
MMSERIGRMVKTEKTAALRWAVSLSTCGETGCTVIGTCDCRGG